MFADMQWKWSCLNLTSVTFNPSFSYIYGMNICVVLQEKNEQVKILANFATAK